MFDKVALKLLDDPLGNTHVGPSRDVEIQHRDRRHEHGARIPHQLGSFLVKKRPVLDRVDTRTHGVLDRLGCLRMACDAHAVAMGLLHRGRHLFDRHRLLA